MRDKTRCANCRGINLIDVAAKVIAIVLLRRFQAVRYSRTRPNQARFRAGRGCADQIFTLRRILEFHHSYQQPTAVCFIDFAAAFDSVHRESLWRIMAPDGVPAKIIAMIKACYRSTTAGVLVRNNLSQPFVIQSGVLQGCILSPILLNYAVISILEGALHESDGVEFAPGHRLTDLDYTDDIALLVSSFRDLQSMVPRVNEIAKSVGLSINAGKTKVFSICMPDQEKAPLGIDDCQLEEVDSFKYLGASLLPNGQSKDDIISRIDAACWVFSSLRKCLWIRRDLSIATKIRVYRASVRSVLLYGCECWALRVEDERKLEVFDHHCLRTILRVQFTDFVSNETVRARCDNIARITQDIQERRLKWFGHVLRRPPQELSVTALDPTPLPHWRRRSGAHFKTWLDTVRQDREVVLGPSVFGLRYWRREWAGLSRSAAADRHAWRDPGNWSDNLPLALLGICAALKSNLDCSAAELVFGTTFRLRGEVVTTTSCAVDETPDNFVHRLRQFMRSLSPVPPRTPLTDSYVEKDWDNCTHVFVRCDRVHQPLESPYEGPFRVLARNAKTCRILRGDKQNVVDVDRVKAAVAEELPDLSQGQKCAGPLTPVPLYPLPPAYSPFPLPSPPLPSTPPSRILLLPTCLQHPTATSSSTIVRSQPSSTVASVYITHSGRHVRFSDPFYAFFLDLGISSGAVLRRLPV
ncbi:hypothetical protein SprV_0802571200 [Sparganum proliferum]